VVTVETDEFCFIAAICTIAIRQDTTYEIRTVWAGPMIMSLQGELICDIIEYVYDHMPATWLADWLQQICLMNIFIC